MPKTLNPPTATQLTFDDPSFPEPEIMYREADISPDKLYRYSLLRSWNANLPRVCFIMLNPSTADDKKDDPTLTRCIGFARRHGYGSLEIVNLYAFRTSDPEELFAVPVDQKGKGIEVDNVHESIRKGKLVDVHIHQAVQRSKCVICAWGAEPRARNRAAQVMATILDLGAPTFSFGLTAEGHPRHPLYLSIDTELIPYPQS